MTFTKKELEVLKKVVELENIEPENNHLHNYIVRPVKDIIKKLQRGEDIEIEVKLLQQQLKNNTDKCRNKRYNNRIVKLREVIIEK